MKHEDFLTHLVDAVRQFGRESLTMVNHPESKEFGFRTPEGVEVLCSLQELRDYFEVPEEEFGPEGHGLPPDDVIRMHLLMVEDAIAEGLRLRAMH